MPNWVLNRILFKGNKDDIVSIADLLLGEENNFDLDKVIPMPWELLHVQALFPSDYSKLSDEEKKPYISNVIKYGFKDWYDWRLENWGTKWNTKDVRGPYIIGTGAEVTLEYVFKTAWAAPFPVMNKLAETYPDVWIQHALADEDIGFNCGYLIKEAGKTAFETQFEGNGDEKSQQLALTLWDYEYLNEEADKEESSNESD